MYLLGIGETLEEWTHKEIRGRSGTQYVTQYQQGMDDV